MATVQKWGNSLAVRIPARMAESLAVQEGTTLDLQVEGNAIVMRAKRRRRYRLSDLLSGCTPSKRHAECDFGPDKGAEVIS